MRNLLAQWGQGVFAKMGDEPKLALYLLIETLLFSAKILVVYSIEFFN